MRSGLTDSSLSLSWPWPVIRRAQDLKVDGIYILICRNPSHLQVDATSSTKQRAFTPNNIEVHLRRRTHTPALLDAGYQTKKTEIPWWGGRTLSYTFPAR